VRGVGEVDAASSALHWYDFVCPFCYVGRARTAILLETGLEVISWPFQAHPDIPAGGLLVGLQPASEFQRVAQDALRQRARSEMAKR
jgi:predicted DsbA family dithiol-disulfide isomerase